MASINIKSVSVYGTKKLKIILRGKTSYQKIVVKLFSNNKQFFSNSYEYKDYKEKIYIEIPIDFKSTTYELRIYNNNDQVYFSTIEVDLFKRFTKRLREFFSLNPIVMNEENTDDNLQIVRCKNYGLLHPQIAFDIISDNSKATISFRHGNKNIFCDNVNLEEIGNNKGSYHYEMFKTIPFYYNSVIINVSNNNVDLIEIFINNNFFLKIFHKIHKIFRLIARAIRFCWRKYHFLVPPKMIPYYFRTFREKYRVSDANLMFLDPFNNKDYNLWLMKHEHIVTPKKFNYNPLISIAVPVYNVPIKYLKSCIDSVINQIYKNWELCLADDLSSDDEIRSVLAEYAKNDKRIKVIYRKTNGGISEATNSAFSIATGEFVSLLDDDDVLSDNALYEVVNALNCDKRVDFIYSDEDKLDPSGERCCPYFKSDWSPDTLMSNNYICHFSVFSKELLNLVGGERTEYNGAQDYDLILRLTEKAKKIYHVPKVLYHWRIIPGSTSDNISAKQYAVSAGKEAIISALKRRNLGGSVTSNGDGTYIVNYKNSNPHITIIIPTRDYVDILKKCVDSIYEKTKYKNFDILIVDNNSEKKETFNFFNEYKKRYKNFDVLRLECEFNYSYINNEAVRKAKGDYILLLNNDTSIITDNFLEQMVGFASLSHVGAVGAKLYYPDGTIQHGGVVLGIRGIAGHAYTNCPKDYALTFGKLKMPCDYGAVTAACLMISKKKYFKIGGLDEKLKINYNDVEFCVRLLAAGYYNVFLGQVELIHYESKSRGINLTQEQVDKTSKEREYVIDKWKEIIFNDPFYNPNYSKNDIYKLEK
jgi:GT2 family glycosyltransferase